MPMTMTTPRRFKRFVAAALIAASIPAVAAAAVRSGPMSGQKIPFGYGNGGPTGVMVVDDMHITHSDGFKGAKRVAISVFNVAFPTENTLTANMRAKAGNLRFSSKASMHTSMSGVDQDTQQRIADAAYAEFVGDLQRAGFDVVGQEELARVAPEYASWGSVPNFTPGRFGVYVAPTGRKVRLLRGDTAKRDTSGVFGQSAPAFRGFDSPQAFSRSPYIAQAANIGILAVTLVIDYGSYTSTGETGRRNDLPEITFQEGVTAQSGNFYDTATVLDYWGPKSGGFPAMATLAAPVISDQQFATLDAANPSEISVKAEATKFEKGAIEVAAAADSKLVHALAAAAAH